MSHTILLVQTGKSTNTRTYYDYPNVNDAMSGLCRVFESKLKEENPTQRNITYDVRDLFNWIDSLGDMGCLVLDTNSKMFSPHDKDWVKQKVLSHLKKLANA